VNAVDSQGDQAPYHEAPFSTMPIVDERGDTWNPIIIANQINGYLREVDSFFWTSDPRIPVDTSINWLDNRTVRLPPTVSEIQEERQRREGQEKRF